MPKFAHLFSLESPSPGHKKGHSQIDRTLNIVSKSVGTFTDWREICLRMYIIQNHEIVTRMENVHPIGSPFMVLAA